jgi:hypothetical protein
MKKYVYVILENYEGPMYNNDPHIIEVHTDLETAIKSFENIIADSQPSEGVEFEDYKEVLPDGRITYNLTNFEEDYNLTIKLQKTQLI